MGNVTEMIQRDSVRPEPIPYSPPIPIPFVAVGLFVWIAWILVVRAFERHDLYVELRRRQEEQQEENK